MGVRAFGTADVGSVIDFPLGHHAIHKNALNPHAVFLQVFAGNVSVHGNEKGSCGVASSHHHNLGRDQCCDCGGVSVSACRHFATGQMCDHPHHMQKLPALQTPPTSVIAA